MPALKNQRHELFAQGLARGLSPEKAYQEAGYKPHRQNAHRMMTGDDIASRVAELTKPAIKATELSAQAVLEGLLREATREGEGSTHGARVSAWGLLGKYYKLFTDKVEADVNVTDGTDGRARLESLIARQLAAQNAEGGSSEPE